MRGTPVERPGNMVEERDGTGSARGAMLRESMWEVEFLIKAGGRGYNIWKTGVES